MAALLILSNAQGASKRPVMIIAKMPTATYLRKYALWREGLPADGVLDLTTGGPIVCVLGAMLAGKVQADPQGAQDVAYDDGLPFYVNERRLSATRRYFISPDNVRLFNTFLRKDLRRTLLDRLAARPAEIPETRVIWGFMETVGIIDDISVDALVKGIYRTRVRRKNEKNPFFGN